MLSKCINPRNWNYTDTPWDKKVIHFGKTFNQNDNYYTFKCGRCFYCQQHYSNQWAVRLMLESQLHTQKCFITLTYNPENLPHNNSLRKRDTQLFIKRLRKKIFPLKVRYFLAGEYGGRKGRPHYHLVLFGWVPDDLVYLKQTGKNEIIYNSKILSKLWGKGFISIGINMTLNSLKYVAKYMSKMQTFDPLKQAPPFSTQSNRPGLARKAFSFDIYETDKIYLEGKQYTVPRYFDKIAEELGYDLTDIKKARDEKVKSYGNASTTMTDRKEYKNFLESQGYDIKHLFSPSKKQIDKYFLTYDRNGVLKETDFKKDLAMYYKWQYNSFFGKENIDPDKIVNYESLSINDFYDFHSNSYTLDV